MIRIISTPSSTSPGGDARTRSLNEYMTYNAGCSRERAFRMPKSTKRAPGMSPGELPW